MSQISKNLAIVREQMRISCLKRAAELQNREPRLVAVSKTKPKELVIEAYNCGQRHFGENYVKEIVEKALDEELLKACPDIKWHFIGHLQSNKIGKLLSIPSLFVIETVDSEKLANALNSWVQKNYEEPKRLNIFIQVNTSGEEAKSGCQPNKAKELMKFTIEKCNCLNVLGLMTIGKYNNCGDDKINPDFQCLLECASNICKEFKIDPEKFEISMGMSGDFQHAIELGSTNIRVGSSIFGERN